MANWSNPVLTSTYTNFLAEVKDRDVDLALQFDGTTSTNLATGTIRWNSTANRWQKWNGSAWAELTTVYALTGLSTTGAATIGTTLGVTGQTTLATATATTPATADNNTNIATTAFVKAQNYAPLASPSLTGTPLATTAAVTTNTTQIATTAFVNAEIANDAVLLSGSTMTGALTLSGDPTAENHATTKHWVEARAFKDACRVATAAALTVTATTTTLTNAGTLASIAIDGISLSVGDRVLVKDQATTAQNGIYTVTTVGSGAVAWVLTRGTDSDTWNDLPGAVVAVEQGTANDNTVWLSTTAIGGTLGSTAITWQLVSNAQVAAVGNLATTGLFARTAANTFTARSIAVSGTGLSVTNANGVAGDPTVTSNATNTNTGNTIVARDASGNFSAGTITATLSGSATSATTATTATSAATWTTGRTIALTGGVTGTSAAFNGSANLSFATTISNGAVSAAKLDGAQSGSAPIYGARAWVNFNGNGTIAIRAADNVSSITDNGVGNYTINFTTAMVSANYAICLTAKEATVNAALIASHSSTNPTAGSCTIITGKTIALGVYTFTDADYVNVSVFR